MGELVERLVLDRLHRWWADVKPVRRSVSGLISIAVIVGFLSGWFAHVMFSSEKMAAFEQRQLQIEEARELLGGVPPEEITNEIRKLKSKVDKIQERNVSVDNLSFTKNEDGTFTTKAIIRVASEYAPNWLVVYAEAEGIVSVNAGGQIIIGRHNLRISDRKMAARIKTPAGRYTITVVSRNVPVRLSFEFR